MDFLTFLQTQRRILLDGAMGTQLDSRGMKPGGQDNLTNPEVVLEIHREYARCGCHALITNTLTMNRIYIETHHLDVEVQEVNRAGVELARQAADNHQYVLGDISSTGQLLEPYGTYKESEFYDAFREQAEILGEAGVDGFIIETMFDLREALCALRACRDIFSLPVIVSMAFTTEAKGGRTIMGNSAEECARRITDSGGDVVGANCGDLDPFQMGVVVSLLQSATSLPILAQPNAGKPQLVDNVTVYGMDPTRFAAGIVKCTRAGARLVGGCCGTSPAHIRAVAGVFDET
ncbi:MAG: 5-methyltetrahydrofolate--homocysteine methyltransferase [Proteobacteria bacterium]|nr:5-methyltetrahydrofolate--homocysteine methyltransferase [Pseudomonadota bacterium]